MKTLCVLFIAATGLLIAGSCDAHSRKEYLEKVVAQAFGDCGDPCVVRFSPGGPNDIFTEAAKAVNDGGKKMVVIDGTCVSACTIFADKARPHVCVTENAVFAFHLARINFVFPIPDAIVR